MPYNYFIQRATWWLSLSDKQRHAYYEGLKDLLDQASTMPQETLEDCILRANTFMRGLHELERDVDVM